MCRRRRRNINNRTVAALTVEKDTVVWDRRLAGFGVRAYASGTKVYVAQARGPGGTRRIALGRHGVLGAAEARRLAARAIQRIVAGKEPLPRHTVAGRGAPTVAEAGLAERGLTPQAVVAGHGGPTVAEAAGRYLEEHVKVRCKPTTARVRESLVRVHIAPALGKMPLAAVRREDVVGLHERLAATPTHANSVVKVLSQIFSMARSWELVPRGADPCARIELYRQRKRERFLTEAEIERLGRVLEDALETGGACPAAVAAIRLLALTGCRKNEILTLRWEDVDLAARELRLRDAKTGPRAVPLSPVAVQLLAGLSRSRDGEWVIPGGRPGTHLRKLGNTWRRLRVRARLEDVRLHDLRHTFASSALALGESLPMIAKLLGHSDIASTARYAHLARGAVREAAERVAGSIAKDIL